MSFRLKKFLRRDILKLVLKNFSKKCFVDIGRCSINFRAREVCDPLLDADLNVRSIASIRNMLPLSVPAQFQKRREIRTGDRHTVGPEKYKES
jgi:hypothetical protein